MIQSYNKNQIYFSACAVYILKIIIYYPQFNNYENICEVFDIYIRKIVMINSAHSLNIKTDCIEMIDFFYETDYISQIVSSFEVEEDAYHYLAILVQFQRITNRYKLVSSSPYHYFNPTNIYNAIVGMSF